MTDDEYMKIELMYPKLLATVPTWQDISISKVQREFRFGYNRAATLLETLAENGHIRWDKITGKFSRLPTNGRAGQ